MFLINYYTKEHIKKIENWLSLTVSSFTTYCLYNILYIYNSEPIIASKYVSMSLDLIFYYCTFDLFLTTTPSVIYHHILVILMYLFLYYNVDYSLNIGSISVVLLTEVSTIFLILNDYIESIFNKKSLISKYITGINSICFLLTFTYTRIYSFLFNFIVNPEPYNYLNKIIDNKLYIQYFYCLIYLFFILNICWFCQIIRIAVKPFKEYINNSFHYQQYYQRYIHICNIPIIFIIYGIWLKEPISKKLLFECMVEILGYAVLSVSSYFFHKSIYETTIRSHQLTDEYKNNANIFCKTIYPNYIFDGFGIHLRSFLSVVSHSHFSIKWSYISFVIHIISFTLFYIFVNVCTYNIYINMDSPYLPNIIKKYISEYVGHRYYYNDFNKSNEYYNKNIKIGIAVHIPNGIPVIIDMIIVWYFSNNFFWKEIFVTTTIFLAVVLQYQPIYTYSHLLFHIIIWIQTISLCMIKINH